MLDVKRCKSSKTKAYSFYRRPPKHSKTTLFFSIVAALIDNRDTAPHRFDDANRYTLCITFTPFGDRDIDDPTRTPPNPSAAVAVLLQLQDRNFSSSVAKGRLSNSFAFDSFVRKQASVGESKKRKKTQVDFSWGLVRNLRTMLCTPLNETLKISNIPDQNSTKVGFDLTRKVLNEKERVTHRTKRICCCCSLFHALHGLQAARQR